MDQIRMCRKSWVVPNRWCFAGETREERNLGILYEDNTELWNITKDKILTDIPIEKRVIWLFRLLSLTKIKKDKNRSRKTYSDRMSLFTIYKNFTYLFSFRPRNNKTIRESTYTLYNEMGNPTKDPTSNYKGKE